jgi:heat shock protein HslJ
MKTLRYIVLMSLAALLLASCAGLPPVFPAKAPAEEAVPSALAERSSGPAVLEEPVQADTTVAQAEPVIEANPLTGVLWEWAALLKTKPATQSVVPDPASYTAIFDGQGNLSIQADCNTARATYVLENDKVVLLVEPVTGDACRPGSLSADFLTRLGKVGSYMIDGDDLILRLGDTGDSMIFRNGGPAPEPAAPAAAVPTEAPAGEAVPAATPELVGPTWQWEQLIDAAGSRDTAVDEPEKYTVMFNADGTAAMKADCNQAAGTYVLDGANLSVAVGPVTLAMCAADSLSESFLVNLTSVATYGFEDGKLILEMMADGGTMVFGAAK